MSPGTSQPLPTARGQGKPTISGGPPYVPCAGRSLGVLLPSDSRPPVPAPTPPQEPFLLMPLPSVPFLGWGNEMMREGTPANPGCSRSFSSASSFLIPCANWVSSFVKAPAEAPCSVGSTRNGRGCRDLAGLACAESGFRSRPGSHLQAGNGKPSEPSQVLQRGSSKSRTRTRELPILRPGRLLPALLTMSQQSPGSRLGHRRLPFRLLWRRLVGGGGGSGKSVEAKA